MFFVTSLASSSSGNSYFVEHTSGGFLIDAGISAAQICERLSRIGKSIEDVHAIFLTHEHTDHIRGVSVLHRRFNTPVFATPGTIDACKFSFATPLLADKPFDFRGLTLLPFTKHHDASDPVSFQIKDKDACVSVVTDIGFACDNVKRAVSDSTHLVIEANHDYFMLKNGRYPKHLQERILGKQGHLSNYECALLLLEHATPKLRHVLLAHLSDHNNSVDVALRTIRTLLGEREDLAHVRIDAALKHDVVSTHTMTKDI